MTTPSTPFLLLRLGGRGIGKCEGQHVPRQELDKVRNGLRGILEEFDKPDPSWAHIAGTAVEDVESCLEHAAAGTVG